MIVLYSMQDATISAWLTNVRLPAADCLSRRQTTKRCDQVDMAMSISVLCVEITKPEPTMSYGRVFRLRIVKKRCIFWNI